MWVFSILKKKPNTGKYYGKLSLLRFFADCKIVPNFINFIIFIHYSLKWLAEWFYNPSTEFLCFSLVFIDGALHLEWNLY